MKIKDMIKKIHKNNDGVSLIELLVAIVLLALIVGAFLSAFEFTTRNNITSGQVVDAGYDAQTMMEEVISIANSSSPPSDAADLAKTINEGVPVTGVDDLVGSVTNTIYTITKTEDVQSIKIIITENAFINYPNLIKIWIETDGSSSDSEASIQNIISIGE